MAASVGMPSCHGFSSSIYHSAPSHRAVCAPASAPASAPAIPRPKLVPDKRVYRGCILSDDDAERAYVNIHRATPAGY